MLKREQVGVALLPVAIVLCAAVMVPVALAAKPHVKDQTRLAKGAKLAVYHPPQAVLSPEIITKKVHPVVTLPTPFGVVLRLRGNVSTTKLPKPLRTFLVRVQEKCAGFKVVSACRPGARVAGSGRPSLHASCQAADYQVRKPACALQLAKGWPGGHSVDYRAVNHFHASWSPKGREWKARFSHYSNKRRYAKRGYRA